MSGGIPLLVGFGRLGLAIPPFLLPVPSGAAPFVVPGCLRFAIAAHPLFNRRAGFLLTGPSALLSMGALILLFVVA